MLIARTYTDLLKMHGSCLWAIDMWLNSDTKEAEMEALRFKKILERIEEKMWQYPSTNLFKENVLMG